MNVNAEIRKRKIGLRRRIEIDFAMDRIRLKEVLRLTSSPQDESNLKTYGPMACCRLNNDAIAVANEDGYINLLQMSSLKNTAHWMGHENAIFDMKATPDQRTLLTASGDCTIKQWDVESRKEILSICQHYSSVKSISIYDKDVVASGSRDGSIQVHDFRSKNPSVIVIRDAHRNSIIGKRRKMVAKTDPISCVTNVVFDPNFPRIYSTGANDATIKLWDLRRKSQLSKPRRTIDGKFVINQPYVQVKHPSKGMHCGYSHLLISSNKIYAACSDNKIYCYENFGSEDEPIKFTGYSYDTYLKLAVMDDRFLFSGTKGGGATMWTLGNKPSSRYPIQLKPDDNDPFDTNVVETDWDSLSIFTFRDDRLVSKWTIQ